MEDLLDSWPKAPVPPLGCSQRQPGFRRGVELELLPHFPLAYIGVILDMLQAQPETRIALKVAEHLADDRGGPSLTYLPLVFRQFCFAGRPSRRRTTGAACLSA